MTKEEIQKNSEHWYNKYKDAEKRIAELEKENTELKKSVNNWLKYEKETQYHKSIIKDLKKENAELKTDNDARKFAMAMSEKVEKQMREQIEKMKEEHKQNELGLVISNSSARVELNEKVEQLEKENAELKGLKDVVTLIRANNDTIVTLMQLNNKLVSKNQQLAIAKDLIHQFLIQNPISDWLPKKAEQFLKEIEK